MNKQKITPEDRKNIVTRVKSGEKQKDVARDYDISKGYLSKIVKQAKEKAASDVFDPVSQQMNMSGFTTEQLRNRYRMVHIELLKHYGEFQQRLLEADGLQQSIEMESAKPEGLRDEGWILAQKTRLTWCQDTTRITRELIRLYQEVPVILQMFVKRGVPVPVGVSIRNGLIPASKAK